METRKAFFIVLGASVCVIGFGIGYQLAGMRRDRRKFPAPGRFVDVNGHQLHLYATGSGSPAVVLESGIAASSLSWALVQPEIAKFTRVCSYDRAGLGWSDVSTAPCSLQRAVGELRSALFKAGISPPYILAGHSFGGLIVRAYSARHPKEVAGLVLIDSVLPAEWMDLAESQQRLLDRGMRLSRRGALLARFGVVRFSLWLLSAGAHTAAAAVSRVFSGRGSGVVARLTREVRKLPPAVLPVIQAHWSDPKSFHGMADHLEALPAAAAEVAGLEPASNIPIVILSATDVSPQQKRAWNDLASRGQPGKHVIARQSGHWIPFDDPNLVIEAVREIVKLVKST